MLFVYIVHTLKLANEIRLLLLVNLTFCSHVLTQDPSA